MVPRSQLQAGSLSTFQAKEPHGIETCLPKSFAEKVGPHFSEVVTMYLGLIVSGSPYSIMGPTCNETPLQ